MKRITIAIAVWIAVIPNALAERKASPADFPRLSGRWTAEDKKNCSPNSKEVITIKGNAMTVIDKIDGEKYTCKWNWIKKGFVLSCHIGGKLYNDYGAIIIFNPNRIELSQKGSYNNGIYVRCH